MRLPELSIKNYQFTIVVVMLLTIWGVLSYLRMPRMENPEITIPGGAISVIYPGASPADLEQLVAAPIEEAINELEHIKKINTTLRDGIAIFTVEFEYGTDAEDKYDEMVRAVNTVKNDLPEDIFQLNIMQYKSSDVAMLQLALVSETLSYREMVNEAENLKRDLNKVAGIRKVEIHAHPEEELRVALDFEKMAALNISLDQVGMAIKSHNMNIPGGDMDLDERNFNIKTSGAYEDLEEIENTIVSSYQGKVVYLKSIADIHFDYEDNIYYARHKKEQKQKAIFVVVKQKEGLNIFAISKKVEPLIDNFSKQLPSNTSIYKVFNQKTEVSKKINGFLFNLLQGIILVGLVVFLAIGVRSSLIVITAIPMSIIIGLGFVNLFGHGLEQISIAGLVVALGLLVDNSIVIIENINRYIGKGFKPAKAAVLATAEIGWPVVTATVTTLLAFIPIITMPDKSGDFIRSMPVTIFATLSVSLLLALTLTPMIAGLTFKGKDGRRKKNGAIREQRVKKHLGTLIEGPYRRTLNYTLKKSRNRWLIILIAFGLLLSSVFVFTTLRKSLFPKAEKPQFLIKINMPEGTSLNKTDKTALMVEQVLDTIDLVESYTTNIGHGNPRIYYNEISHNYAKNYAEIYVKLKEYNRAQFDALILGLRNHFDPIPGVNINIKEFEQGVPTDAPIMVYIHGLENDKLREIAGEVSTLLAGQNGAINIESKLDKRRTDIHLKINKDKANLLGVPVSDIDKTIRAAVAGITVSSYRDADGEDYNIVLRMATGKNIRISDFDKIHVSSLSGKKIPLKQFVEPELDEAPGIITRYNLERTALVTADVEKGGSIDDIMFPVISMLETYPFPPGYSYHIGGELENREETFGGLSKAIFIALIAIFAVLVLQFRSFVQPIVIFASVVFAIIGSAWALFLTGNPFSFTAGIGFTSLIGIVINNSIILVDYSNQLIKQGKGLVEAVIEAGETRFTPIILTTLTTIGGLLPLTLTGGSLWAPMGWTIIGGLLVSTMLTLVLVPVFYSMLTKTEKASATIETES